MSLANMETLVNIDFNDLETDEIKENKKLAVIQEVSNEDIESTQSTVTCDETNRSSDSQGTTSETQRSTSLKINQQNVQSSTLINPHVYPGHPMMFRHPASENMHASLPTNYPSSVQYRPVSPMDGPFHMSMPPRGPPTLLTSQSLIAGQMAQDYLSGRSLPSQHFFNTMYHPHQTAPYPMSHYGPHPGAPSTISYGEQPNLTTGTSTSVGFNHSSIPNQYRNMHPAPGYYPGQHSIDLGMHDFYYRSQRPSFNESRNVISLPSEITFQGKQCVSIISNTNCSVTNNSEQQIQVNIKILCVP